MREHLAGIFTRWEIRLLDGCRRAAVDGKLRVGVDPERMARAVLAQLEGLILLAKVQNRAAADIVAGLEDMLALYLVDEALVS
ncbi:MAG: TetR family transcriptional regulator C-terminal domain-containing protein [Rhodococcus sp. (in: high G+C Gram-positive bacteria)]|uniref:TetR family transcriptional regulator C-terminal domain-containing protein n=1 Tax=Rhodococcus sp. TaxID=1831 RepID=UPI003BB0676C